MQDSPSTLRVRENQRRSRARRKDLLESLQKRVREFELQGVQATLEMQQAARKVAQENQQLRRLLALHGVSREEVESFLRSVDQPNAAECCPTTGPEPRVPSLTCTPQRTVAPSVPDTTLSPRNSVAQGPRTCPLPTAASVTGGRYLTSCETAASIIVEMSGHKDRELVRAALGCKSKEDCKVKNTTVLQVMGEL
ncbi:uncharacterized protein EI97DRAFT_377659 [Westerdykella ornata]|uniref:BZIP domain-containing protein n=1 Tax=Westerdykella ornata TaxID=318751 RepID=A0A6A6JI63_WESOR|nr:uncharacterized protein EI97DRAFT_377659 [Westerdykella ornata]KAF2276241.1 hypothetical protein EI97DRAFT_377659 [Westerdykella ornata]